jgi:hypothetical protein
LRKSEDQFIIHHSSFIIPFTFGRFSIRLELPAAVRSAQLPAYIQSFEGDLLPRVDATISLEPIEAAPPEARPLPRRYGFHRALALRVGDAWRIFTHLPIGPARPDALPLRAVIPALFTIFIAAGVVPVHASAVLHRGRAVVIPGRSGSGKSTTAAALVGLGADFFADDRLLAWIEDDQLLFTPSFELGNPFTRWAGRRPEEDRLPPPRRRSLFGMRAELGALVFPEVHPGAPSSLARLSRAASLARLASSCAVDWPFPPPDVFALGLTLGESAGTVLAQILSS